MKVVHEAGNLVVAGREVSADANACAHWAPRKRKTEDSNLILHDGDVQTTPRSLASGIACDNTLCSIGWGSFPL